MKKHKRHYLLEHETEEVGIDTNVTGIMAYECRTRTVSVTKR